MKVWVAAIVSILVVQSAGAQQNNGTWTLPLNLGAQPYHRGACVSDGAYLYTFGNGTLSVILGSQANESRRYSPVTGTWTTFTSSLVVVNNAGVYINGSLYSFGGPGNLAGIYQYPVSSGTTGSWTLLPCTLGAARSGCSATVLNGRAYVTGGSVVGIGIVADVEEFDPSAIAAGPLRAMAPMPAPRLGHGLTGYPDGKIYSFGGTTGTYTASVLAFDPNVAPNGIWTQRPNIDLGAGPVIRAFTAPFVLQNRIYLAGGYDGVAAGYYATLFEYRPLNDAWTLRTPMTQTHWGYGSGVIGTYGLVYGGGNGTQASVLEQYNPPVFGQPPNPASNVAQSVGATPLAPGGWTGTTITMSGTATDPDAGEKVALEVQATPAGSVSWTGPVVTGSFVDQGLTMSVIYPIPASGAYDWRYRVFDENGNYAPSVGGVPSWTEFDIASPDFNSDQAAPTSPVGISPINIDAQSDDSRNGPVQFDWSPSTDNGPASALRYEIEVSTSSTFATVATGASGLVATTSTLPLPVSRTNAPYYWRVRSKDIGLTNSPWSPTYLFHLVFNDTVDHAGGDGCSASCRSGGWAWLLMLVLMTRRPR